jgi:hypothetical protein
MTDKISQKKNIGATYVFSIKKSPKTLEKEK